MSAPFGLSVMRRKGGLGLHIPLQIDEICVVGSDEDTANICIAKSGVAAAHMRLVPSNQQMWLEQTAEGETLVNSKPVPVGERVCLNAGDIIKIANRSFLFESKFGTVASALKSPLVAKNLNKQAGVARTPAKSGQAPPAVAAESAEKMVTTPAAAPPRHRMHTPMRNEVQQRAHERKVQRSERRRARNALGTPAKQEIAVSAGQLNSVQSARVRRRMVTPMRSALVEQAAAVTARHKQPRVAMPTPMRSAISQTAARNAERRVIPRVLQTPMKREIIASEQQRARLRPVKKVEEKVEETAEETAETVEETVETEEENVEEEMVIEKAAEIEQEGDAIEQAPPAVDLDAVRRDAIAEVWSDSLESVVTGIEERMQAKRYLKKDMQQDLQSLIDAVRAALT